MIIIVSHNQNNSPVKKNNIALYIFFRQSLLCIQLRHLWFFSFNVHREKLLNSRYNFYLGTGTLEIKFNHSSVSLTSKRVYGRASYVARTIGIIWLLRNYCKTGTGTVLRQRTFCRIAYLSHMWMDYLAAVIRYQLCLFGISASHVKRDAGRRTGVKSRRRSRRRRRAKRSVSGIGMDWLIAVITDQLSALIRFRPPAGRKWDYGWKWRSPHQRRGARVNCHRFL